MSIAGARILSRTHARGTLSISLSLLLSLLLSLVIADVSRGAEPQQRLFERVFKDAVKLDPAMIAKVKAVKPGEYVFADRNGDGKNDECWFIDTHVRHTAKLRPILVRVIDEDGDLDADKGPDLDSDLYIADYHADGTVDVVLDYQDSDGDNDVDEMASYFYMSEHPFFGKNVLRVWWGRDDGDDNLLWYDEDYTYYQDRCQYRCHFSGDETFVAFGLTEDSKEWLSAYENPFLFYDPDGDQCSEVVLRIEGKADAIRAIRYSFDADDDAFGRRTHDYDFSITASADDGRPVRIPPDLLESTKLRGTPTQGWLRRDKARAFVETASWSKVMLTWDELNANTEQDVARDPNERWEGIIAHGNDAFKQVGGPACSVFNKRYELSLDPKPPLQLYCQPIERHRLHLKGASKGWISVDYNLDGKEDASYRWTDESGDGRFDRRILDLNADGSPEYTWKVSDESAPATLDLRTIVEHYKRGLGETLVGNQVFADAARSVLNSKVAAAAEVEDWFLNKLPGWMPAQKLGARIRSTPAGAALYLQLISDRLLWALRDQVTDPDRWNMLETAYSKGGYHPAADVLMASQAATPANDKAFLRFSHRIPIRLRNRNGSPQQNAPIVLTIRELKEAGADFDPMNCAVVAPERWIEWREVPCQVDAVNGPDEPELSFLADLPAGGEATWYIYYSPKGQRESPWAARTGAAEDWVPPNIGWESGRTGYRAYWGQFDFFGKKTDALVYPTIGKQSYHDETPWGIDALNTAKTGGIGGLTLFVGDKAYPVRNPIGKGDVKFTKKVLTTGPVRCVVEMAASNIVPERPNLTVRMRPIIYAERAESEMQVSVTGAERECVLAPGLIKLVPREKTFADPEKGCFGAWGWQTAGIGEIGMAVIGSPKIFEGVVDLPEERLYKWRTSGGKLRYWIIGNWRRGRQYPIAPTIDNWKTEVTALAGQLLEGVKVELGKAENVVTN